jgi:arylsulfatase A
MIVRFLLSVIWSCIHLIVSGQQKPNIIFILADDLGYASLGCFGQQKIKTPNLDRLAAEGMKLTNFYTNSICAPSRTSFITGLHSGHSLVRDNHELGGFEDSTEFGQMPLAANTHTIATMLKGAGYTTAAFGKWGLGGPNSSGVPWKQGFDFFYGYLDQKQAHNYYPNHLWKNDQRIPFEGFVSSAHQTFKGTDPNDGDAYKSYKGKVYSNDTITGEAIRFIQSNRAKPFFMYMAYTLPHMALQVPDKYLEPYLGKFDEQPYIKGGYVPHQYPRSAYAAMISLLDAYVGRLVTELKAQHLDKNTLIIFTGDNGAATGGGADPDYFNTSGVFRGRKGTLYEGGIREPFIAWWPGRIKAGMKSDHVATIWDLMPTFAGLAQTQLKGRFDGISFAPLLTGRQQAEYHEFLYWEIHAAMGGMQAVRFGDWKAVIKGTHTSPAPSIELYNLAEDMSETKDVSAAQPNVIARAKRYFAMRELAILPQWNFYKAAQKSLD